MQQGARISWSPAGAAPGERWRLLPCAAAAAARHSPRRVRGERLRACRCTVHADYGYIGRASRHGSASRALRQSAQSLRTGAKPSAAPDS